MRITKALEKLHRECLAEFDEIQAAEYAERRSAKEDRRFCSVPGAQWDGWLRDQFENKPRFEINKVHLAVIRIINEYRNNRITVDFVPKDGTKDDETADACDGLYRADEKASVANEAYDNAFDEGVKGGYGAWRLCSEYEDEDDDENDAQRVKILPIFDAESSVFFDLGAKRQDKGDAKRAYVLTPYPIDAYKEEWGDDPASWDNSISLYEFDWCTPELVWVCEHYRVEETKELVHFYRGVDDSEIRVTQEELDEDEGREEELAATGYVRIRSKRIERKKVHKYILSGGRVLEDCGYIPGRCIPIVPFYAKRSVIDGVERVMGHVRLAKDAQRLQNMLMSWLAELAASFKGEIPIFTPEQIAGHAHMWAEANVKNFPFLLVNPMTDANGTPTAVGPTAYTKAPNVPPAMVALMQLAQDALTEILGNQQQGEVMEPNMSGKAVELIQGRLDMQSYIYMSNFAKAMKRSGEIWQSMMKDLAVEQSRKMKIIGADGEMGQTVINEPAYDEETGQEVVKNDMSRINYDVDVEVGPTSTSARAATVRAVTGLMQFTANDAEMNSVLASTALMNIEGEGLADIRQWVRRRLVRMGVVKPTEDEIQQMQAEAANQQLGPQEQYFLAAAENEQAKAQKARADTVDTIAAADLKVAQTDKVRAETGGATISTVENLQRVLQNQQPQFNEGM